MIMSIIKFNAGYERAVRGTQTPAALFNLHIWSYAFKNIQERNGMYFLLQILDWSIKANKKSLLLLELAF